MIIDSIYGSIVIVYNGDNMMSIRQEGSCADVKVSLDEAATLAKGIFGKRNKILKKNSPPNPTPQPQPVIPSPKKSKTSSSYKAKQMATHPNAYRPWTPKEEEKLKELHAQGKGVNEIAELLNRGVGGISARLKRLGLI